MHSHGPVSSKAMRASAAMDRRVLEDTVIALRDLRPSEIPNDPEWDWWRQQFIDEFARKAGELPRAVRG
ncbi:MAG TPA: hypothetical protein VMB51_05305 [Solirubrobacteraceae bacterium]|nr:hypothetical protein [Solirubrobacteraceae bacterium]